MSDDNTKTYKITLRSTVDVEVEVAADSIEEARAKAFEWHTSHEGVGEFDRYYIASNGDHIEEEFTLWWQVCDTDNEIVKVEELECDDSDDEEHICSDAGMDLINDPLREFKNAVGLDSDIVLGPLSEAS